MPGLSHQHRPSVEPTPAAPAVPGVGGGSRAQSRYGNSFLAEQLAQQQGPGAAPDLATATSSAATSGVASGGTGAAVAQAPASTATPLRISNPLPVQEGEQRRTVLGVQIIGTGVSPSALDGCESFVRMTLGNRPDIQQRLQRASVALVIIPRGQKMTDVPQFAALRGTRTFDGRLWDDVRGSGGMRVAGGLWAIGVPEENLVTTSPDTDGYGPGYSVGMHELAHTIHSKGVTDAERARIGELYAARQRAGGPWTESYGASNADEYFAQSTNCYFGQNQGIGQNGAAWLRENDRPMYDFLGTIYGPPPGAATQPQGGQAAPANPAPAPAPAPAANA